MLAYENVIVAYDGSDLSEKALQKAIQLAVFHDSIQLHVVYVISPPSYSYPYILAEEMREVMLKQAEEQLGRVRHKLSRFQQGRFDIQILEGQASEELLQYAEKHNADLIIMGSRGLSGMQEWFLGSVSHDVVQRSSFPVLIVK